MFRQPATKLMRPLSILGRASRLRAYSNKGKDPLCAHHKELVPPFSEVCKVNLTEHLYFQWSLIFSFFFIKLKGFELKSDCTTFHMLSSGYDKCCPPPCIKPCPPPCPPCPPPPCPDEPCPK